MAQDEFVINRNGGKFRVIERKEKYWPDDALGIQLCKVRDGNDGLSFWVREDEFNALYFALLSHPIECSTCGAQTTTDPCRSCGHSEGADLDILGRSMVPEERKAFYKNFHLDDGSGGLIDADTLQLAKEVEWIEAQLWTPEQSPTLRLARKVIELAKSQKLS